MLRVKVKIDGFSRWTVEMAERISVKGHYRIVTRDSKGRFTSVRKWQASKKKPIAIVSRKVDGEGIQETAAA